MKSTEERVLCDEITGDELHKLLQQGIVHFIYRKKKLGPNKKGEIRDAWGTLNMDIAKEHTAQGFTHYPSRFNSLITPNYSKYPYIDLLCGEGDGDIEHPGVDYPGAWRMYGGGSDWLAAEYKAYTYEEFVEIMKTDTHERFLKLARRAGLDLNDEWYIGHEPEWVKTMGKPAAKIKH